MSDYPDAPEAVALALMRDIEAAEEKAGRRNRHGNLSERDRLAHPLHGLPLGCNR
jgi:hypothetical protein